MKHKLNQTCESVKLALEYCTMNVVQEDYRYISLTGSVQSSRRTCMQWFTWPIYVLSHPQYSSTKPGSISSISRY